MNRNKGINQTYYIPLVNGIFQFYRYEDKELAQKKAKKLKAKYPDKKVELATQSVSWEYEEVK